jgi:tRNA G46 methylase TrmB
VFEIANATSQDTHVDLGCGDGRLNFMAVDNPSFNVGKSWGVDVDENILKKCIADGSKSLFE